MTYKEIQEQEEALRYARSMTNEAWRMLSDKFKMLDVYDEKKAEFDKHMKVLTLMQLDTINDLIDAIK